MHKYIIKFHKIGYVKYVSHLDLVRVFSRALRRAGLLPSYSQGFNPHVLLTFAHPLGVGIESKGELLELVLEGDLAPDAVKEALNNSMPQGLYISEVKKQEGKNSFPTLSMADYEVSLNLTGQPSIGYIDSFLALPEIIMDKKTKSGTKKTDIKPFIIDITQKSENNIIMRLKTGADNIKPELVVEAMKEYAGLSINDYNVCRLSLLNNEGAELF